MIVAVALDLLAVWAFSLVVVNRVFRIGIGMERGYKRHGANPSQHSLSNV
jgi:hypothetical protein